MWTGSASSAAIAARRVRGAQTAAAAAIEDLTDHTVTGWDSNVSSRSLHGESSLVSHTSTRTSSS